MIQIQKENHKPLPHKFRKNDDVRYAKKLVEYFIKRYTKRGNVVFDPFTGFGTTLLVAKKMGREIIGTEINEERVKYLSQDLGLKGSIISGDIARLDLSKLPQFDFIMTSPPYMNKEDEEDALSGYRFAGSYDDYLHRMGQIFKKIRRKLNSNAIVIIEVSNLKHTGSVTTLAWDIGRTISEILTFEGEVIVSWLDKNSIDLVQRDEYGRYGYGYDHSYCLVFSMR